MACIETTHSHSFFSSNTGVERVHDGQIMVRLKKKRFVVLDYSIQPTETDLEIAATNFHIKIPKGAGRDICKTAGCTKIGVPVCLYDSEPNEPDSLYLRSGLCFHCQRNLNEKRRTERKRPSAPKMAVGDGVTGGANLIYAVGPSTKKFKYKHGGVVELNSDAVIVNGHPEGLKQYGDGYGFQEIGMDLLEVAREGAMDTERLVHAVSSNAVASAAVAAVDSAEAAASAVVVDPHDPTGLLHGTAVGGPHHTTSEDINTLYHKAFQGLNKTIFLLTQWKASWDAAIAAAHETVADSSLADAVASAAALAASDGQHSNSDNMVSLLLAADKRKDNGNHDDDDDDAPYNVDVV